MIRATLRSLLVRWTFGADPAIVLRELRSLRASMLRIHREVLEEAARHAEAQLAERDQLRVMFGQLALQVRIINEEDHPALQRSLAQQRTVLERLARASGDFTAAQLCGVEPEQEVCTDCGSPAHLCCTPQLIESRTCCAARLEAAWTAANKGTPRR